MAVEIPDEGAEWILNVLRKWLSRRLWSFGPPGNAQLVLFQNQVTGMGPQGPQGIYFDIAGPQCIGAQYPFGWPPVLHHEDNSITWADMVEANYKGYSPINVTDETWGTVSAAVPHTITYPAQTFMYDSTDGRDGRIDCNLIYGYAVIGQLTNTSNRTADWRLIWFEAFDAPILFSQDGDQETILLDLCVDERPSCDPDACEGAQGSQDLD